MNLITKLPGEKIELFKSIEEVRELRKRLEEATQNSFDKYAQARRRTYHKAEHIYLD